MTEASKFTAAPTHGYKVSKAALNMLTMQYALEFGKDGFTVLALSPGVSRDSLFIHITLEGVATDENEVAED